MFQLAKGAVWVHVFEPQPYLFRVPQLDAAHVSPANRNHVGCSSAKPKPRGTSRLASASPPKAQRSLVETFVELTGSALKCSQSWAEMTPPASTLRRRKREETKKDELHALPATVHPKGGPFIRKIQAGLWPPAKAAGAPSPEPQGSRRCCRCRAALKGTRWWCGSLRQSGAGTQRPGGVPAARPKAAGQAPSARRMPFGHGSKPRLALSEHPNSH